MVEPYLACGAGLSSGHSSIRRSPLVSAVLTHGGRNGGAIFELGSPNSSAADRRLVEHARLRVQCWKALGWRAPIARSAAHGGYNGQTETEIVVRTWLHLADRSTQTVHPATIDACR